MVESCYVTSLQKTVSCQQYNSTVVLCLTLPESVQGKNLEKAMKKNWKTKELLDGSSKPKKGGKFLPL